MDLLPIVQIMAGIVGFTGGAIVILDRLFANRPIAAFSCANVYGSEHLYLALTLRNTAKYSIVVRKIEFNRAGIQVFFSNSTEEYYEIATGGERLAFLGPEETVHYSLQLESRIMNSDAALPIVARIIWARAGRQFISGMPVTVRSTTFELKQLVAYNERRLAKGPFTG